MRTILVLARFGEKMAHYNSAYATGDAGAFDVRWRHFHPQFSFEQQQRSNFVSSPVGAPLQVIYW